MSIELFEEFSFYYYDNDTDIEYIISNKNHVINFSVYKDEGKIINALSKSRRY